ncbi:MAG TPA: hypothetical protein VGS41_14645 [Chthonomonadales bacterium]|nr:hypothetical protein [Chthonomonadales bacterium]
MVTLTLNVLFGATIATGRWSQFNLLVELLLLAGSVIAAVCIAFAAMAARVDRLAMLTLSTSRSHSGAPALLDSLEYAPSGVLPLIVDWLLGTLPGISREEGARLLRKRHRVILNRLLLNVPAPAKVVVLSSLAQVGAHENLATVVAIAAGKRLAGAPGAYSEAIIAQARATLASIRNYLATSDDVTSLPRAGQSPLVRTRTLLRAAAPGKCKGSATGGAPAPPPDTQSEDRHD